LINSGKQEMTNYMAEPKDTKTHNKAFHADPKSHAPFVALRYNATKATQLFGLVN